MICIVSLPVKARLISLYEQTSFPLLEDSAMASPEVISLKKIIPQDPTHHPSFSASNPTNVIIYKQKDRIYTPKL